MPIGFFGSLGVMLNKTNNSLGIYIELSFEIGETILSIRLDRWHYSPVHF
jgi:hypothetical protein